MNIFKKWYLKQVARHNVRVLHKIINLPPDSVIEITRDESALLDKVVNMVQGSQYITRRGRITYTLPNMETVTLWNVLEARRAETATARIEAWTGDKYSPDTVLDAIKASKYITEQLEVADRFEEYLFQGKGGADDSDDEIKQAKNLLSIVQLTAELFHCSFEDAKQMNYSDAILAISKRNEEIEKEKQQIKNQRS